MGMTSEKDMMMTSIIKGNERTNEGKTGDVKNRKEELEEYSQGSARDQVQVHSNTCSHSRRHSPRGWVVAPAGQGGERYFVVATRIPLEDILDRTPILWPEIGPQVVGYRLGNKFT